MPTTNVVLLDEQYVSLWAGGLRSILSSSSLMSSRFGSPYDTSSLAFRMVSLLVFLESGDQSKTGNFRASCH